MMILFEAFLVGGPREAKDELLSQEVLEETAAQVMTPEEAEAVGFHGLPDDPQGRPRVFIACAPEHERMIHSRLESSAVVGAYRSFTVDT